MRIASVIFVVLMFATGCSMNASVRGSPSLAPRAEQRVASPILSTEIVILTPNVRLGAYTIEITYDPGLVRIDAIGEGDMMVFPSMPVTDTRTFASGRTIVTAQTSRFGNPETERRAHYHVATIVWKKLKTGGAKIAARLTGLFDENGKPISGTVRLTPDEIE